MYSTISAVVVLFFALVLAVCYRKSLLSRNIGDKYDTLLDDGSGKKLSI
jgi:hypothetical protein